MDYVRVCGVCLLLVLVATALPMDVLAQTPQAATGSGATPSDGTAGGAAQSMSESTSSKSTQGESVSAEKLLKRNSELKPLKRAGGAASTAGAQTAQKAQSTATPAPKTTTVAAPVVTQAEPPTVAPAPPAATPQVSPQSAGSSENRSLSEVTAAPPASVTPVGAANATVQPAPTSGNATPGSAATAAPENVSQNATQNASGNASESSAKEAAPEAEAGKDRIWRQGKPGSTDEYTWTPNTFSGFFYDLKDDVGTETLKVKLQKSGGGYSRSIDSGNLRYKSDVQDIEYKYGSWGSYQVMGFMADKYFAGYKESEVIDRARSLINDGQLRRVLIDSDDESTLTSGSVLPLEEGYELRRSEEHTSELQSRTLLSRMPSSA